MKTFNHSQDRIKARLDDWGVWQREAADHRGWRIRAADFTAVLGVQQRNDRHADPVYEEIQRLSADERRIETTHHAFLELRPARLKGLVWARHVVYPEATTSHLADATGYPRRSIRHDLDIAYAIINELIAQAPEKKTAA